MKFRYTKTIVCIVILVTLLAMNTIFKPTAFIGEARGDNALQGSQTIIFSAEADARVLEGNPNTNYGTISRLDVDSPDEESYIRFTVAGTTGAIQSAVIRLYVSNGSSDGPSIYGTDNSWSEGGITWNNRPAPTTGAIDNLGAMSRNSWVEYNVTSYVTGNGTFNFVFLPDSTNGVRFESREGSPPPELVVLFDSGPTATPTDTPTALPPTPTNTPTPIPPTPTTTPTAGPTSTAIDTPTATHTPIPTDTPVITNTPIVSSITVAAVADARVLGSNPNTNYGAISRLDVDSPDEESYIRFTVSGLSTAVQQATLRLYVSNGSSNGPSIYGTDNSWSEGGITWNNRPAPTTSAIDNLGAMSKNSWVEYNVTSYVTGNGTFNFVFLPDSSNGVRFESREGSPPPELVLSLIAGPTATPTNTPTPGLTATPTNTPNPASVVFVGAGDIADCGSSGGEETASLLDNIAGTVFTVGDNANPNGTTANYNNCYDPTWGRHKARTYPAMGDNEYNTSGAAPYFSYFGSIAGNSNEGYYSFDLGNWHIIVLNSNCSQIGGCDPDSPQGQWLQADLAASPSTCTLAIHHEPLFSSKGGDADLRDFWVPLYAAGADIVLSGHRHNYERFTQQNPDGVADPGRGIRQFVVGTGGDSHSSFDSNIAANSQVRNDDTYGVMKLTLHPTSYDWEFVPVAGQSFTDSGTTSCVTP